MTDTRDGRDIVERLRALSNSNADEAADIIEVHRNSIEALNDGWNKDRAELTRLRSQRVAVPEWQDISTAPRDGSEVIGFQPHVGIIQMAWDIHPQSIGGWICRNGDCPHPTHWMPLPSPPGSVPHPPTVTPSRAAEAERARVIEECAAIADKHQISSAIPIPRRQPHISPLLSGLSLTEIPMTNKTDDALTVIDEIAAERPRQIEVEGWTSLHDDEHGKFEMARAGAFYALHTAANAIPEPTPYAPSNRHSLFLTASQAWPEAWSIAWKKPKDARRNLVRAAALIVAEIERLDRATPVSDGKTGGAS